MKQIRKLKCNNSNKYYFLGQKSRNFFRGYLFITYTKFSQKRTFLTILSLGNKKNIGLKWVKQMTVKTIDPITLLVPTPQNGQAHSNNSSTTAYELFECV